MIAQSRIEPKALSTLLEDLVAVPADDDRVVSDLALDSREVRGGSCFFALSGARQRGLDFAPQAIASGAVAIVTDAEPDAAGFAVPVFTVPGLRAQIGAIAARFFDHPARKLGVHAVTGTNGKTTVAWLTAQALTLLESACGYIGTLGVGTPGDLQVLANTTPDGIALQRHLRQFVENGYRAAAIEVSSHALEQGRVDGLAIDVAAFTNLGHDHLDYHGTIEAYAASKRRLFEEFDLSAAVINIDDAVGREIADSLPAELALWRCSSAAGSSSARVVASDIVTTADGIGFDFVADGQRGRVDSALLGRFNVDNLLLVGATLLAAGHAFERVVACLGQVSGAPGRMEKCGRTAAGASVFVDYAHSPDSLAAAARSLRDVSAGRLIIVFGCGGNRDTDKRRLMGAAAAELGDHVIVTSDNPRDEDAGAIAADIVAGAGIGTSVETELDRASAIARALAAAGPGDSVLIAGKGHETGQIIGERITHFDDREVVRSLLGGMQ